MKTRSDHREGQIKLKKRKMMCQTYRGRIEGWLESVPGLYKSLIERKKGPGFKENWQKNQNCP